MVPKGNIVKLVSIFVLLYGFYIIEKITILSSPSQYRKKMTLEHSICNPHVLKEVLKIMKTKGLLLQDFLSRDNHDIPGTKSRDNHDISGTMSRDNHDISSTQNSSKYQQHLRSSIANLSNDGSKKDKESSSRVKGFVKIIDTSRMKTKSPSERTDIGKSDQALDKKSRVLYVRSIHPMHIDLKSLVRSKIEENVDISVIPINPHPYKYLQRPPECDFVPTKDSFNLLILVKSSIRNFKLREAIRNTWGNVTEWPNVKVVFLIAYNQDLQKQLNKEAGLTRDIIQEDFHDAYKNNTLKTVMGFNWAVEKCTQADELLFVDDDHLIIVQNVLQFLRTFDGTKMKQLYIGYRIDKPEVDRKDGSPWGMNRYDFSQILWPSYLRGGAFLISGMLAEHFVIAFPYVKYISVDDSFLGIVADKLSIFPQHDERFNQKKENINSLPQYFVYHDYKNPEELKTVWKTISNSSESQR